jgi:hypothetical protein
MFIVRSPMRVRSAGRPLTRDQTSLSHAKTTARRSGGAGAARGSC